MKVFEFRDMLNVAARVQHEQPGYGLELTRAGLNVNIWLKKTADVRERLKKLDPESPHVEGKRDALNSLMSVMAKRLARAEEIHEEMLRRIPGCAEPLP